MDRNEMHVVVDMNEFCLERGISKQSIADEMHKDLSVVKKQLSEKSGNMTLSTAYEYAEQLHGAIVFLSDAQLEKLKTLETLESRIEFYQAQHEQADQQIMALTDTVKQQQEVIRQQQAQLDRTYKKIDSKDAMLARMMNKYVLADEKE